MGRRGQGCPDAGPRISAARSRAPIAALRVPILELLAVLLLAGCLAPSFPSQPEPTGPAPEPVPSGELYGRVMRQDGRPATRSTVQIYQLSNQDKARIGVAAVSLGLFCLVPGFCPSPVSAPVNAQGAFAFPADKLKPTPHVTVTARHVPGPGQATGAVVVAQFDHAAGSQQRVPDLRYWEPTVTVGRAGVTAMVTWSALPHATGYTLWTVPADGSRGPRSTGVTTTGATARLDLRPFEDEPTALIVVASVARTVDGRQTSFAYSTASTALPSAGAAPSRGRPCRVGDPGVRLTPVTHPCPLTDGDLDVNADLPVDCASGSPAASRSPAGSVPVCAPATPHRVCVDLGGPRQVSLVVYRTPFLTDGTVVELSPDGVRFDRVGTRTGDPAGDVHPVTVDPPRRASLACVRNDRFGFAGAVLDELSVW